MADQPIIAVFNEGRTGFGSPIGSQGPISSVDNSELFQIQGLNTSSNNSNVCGAKTVFMTKSSRRHPKMLLANNLISSIKIDGRTKMIVQESSLGHV